MVQKNKGKKKFQKIVQDKDTHPETTTIHLEMFEQRLDSLCDERLEGNDGLEYMFNNRTYYESFRNYETGMGSFNDLIEMERDLDMREEEEEKLKGDFNRVNRVVDEAEGGGVLEFTRQNQDNNPPKRTIFPTKKDNMFSIYGEREVGGHIEKWERHKKTVEKMDRRRKRQEQLDLQAKHVVHGLRAQEGRHSKAVDFSESKSSKSSDSVTANELTKEEDEEDARQWVLKMLDRKTKESLESANDSHSKNGANTTLFSDSDPESDSNETDSNSASQTNLSDSKTTANSTKLMAPIPNKDSLDFLHPVALESCGMDRLMSRLDKISRGRGLRDRSPVKEEGGVSPALDSNGSSDSVSVSLSESAESAPVILDKQQSPLEEQSMNFPKITKDGEHFAAETSSPKLSPNSRKKNKGARVSFPDEHWTKMHKGQHSKSERLNLAKGNAFVNPLQRFDSEGHLKDYAHAEMIEIDDIEARAFTCFGFSLQTEFSPEAGVAHGRSVAHKKPLYPLTRISPDTVAAFLSKDDVNQRELALRAASQFRFQLDKPRSLLQLFHNAYLNQEHKQCVQRSIPWHDLDNIYQTRLALSQMERNKGQLIFR